MKRNLMKMITVMLSLVLVIGLFAGCGKDGGTSAGPGERRRQRRHQSAVCIRAIIPRPGLWKQLRQHMP